MPRFKVELTRTLIESGVIYVDAAGQDDAYHKVSVLLEDGDDAVEWEAADIPFGGETQIEEIEELPSEAPR